MHRPHYGCRNSIKRLDKRRETDIAPIAVSEQEPCFSNEKDDRAYLQLSCLPDFRLLQMPEARIGGTPQNDTQSGLPRTLIRLRHERLPV
jgi:hypothetical protein